MQEPVTTHVDFKFWMPAGLTFRGTPRSVTLHWDALSGGVPERRPGFFFFRLKGVPAGEYKCFFVVAGEEFDPWRAEIDAGGPKLLKRHGTIPINDVVATRDFKLLVCLRAPDEKGPA